MDILVIGAGAVGLVYGRHLELGGATVSYLVRPKYVDGLRAGTTLYQLRKKDVREPIDYRPAHLLTTLDEVREKRWDQVWLCVPATSLSRPWVDEVIGAIGDATLVIFPAGIEIVDALAPVLPPERTVFGLIAMMSYPAPLPGESVPRPGIAYWLPPGKTVFSGPAARRDAVIDALKRGKCGAARHKDARLANGFGGAVLISLIVALEGQGWSFERLRAREPMREMVAAIREALVTTGAHLGVSPPFYRHLLRPWTAGLIVRVLRRIAPLDVERFFQVHFTKVGAQTRLQMGDYVGFGERHGKPVEHLRRLCDAAFGADWRAAGASGNPAVPPAPASAGGRDVHPAA